MDKGYYYISSDLFKEYLQEVDLFELIGIYLSEEEKKLLTSLAIEYITDDGQHKKMYKPENLCTFFLTNSKNDMDFFKQFNYSLKFGFNLKNRLLNYLEYRRKCVEESIKLAERDGKIKYTDLNGEKNNLLLSDATFIMRESFVNTYNWYKSCGNNYKKIRKMQKEYYKSLYQMDSFFNSIGISSDSEKIISFYNQF